MPFLTKGRKRTAAQPATATPRPSRNRPRVCIVCGDTYAACDTKGVIALEPANVPFSTPGAAANRKPLFGPACVLCLDAADGDGIDMVSYQLVYERNRENACRIGKEVLNFFTAQMECERTRSLRAAADARHRRAKRHYDIACAASVWTVALCLLTADSTPIEVWYALCAALVACVFSVGYTANALNREGGNPNV